MSIKVIFGAIAYLSCSAAFAENIKAPPNISSKEQRQFSDWYAAYKEKSPDMSTTKRAKYINELIHSDSPYLLQHAFNPINWKPWSRKILTEAKRQNKLILLSIGYSTCHWCHVMNKESFASLQVAEFVNENYLAIKVDRELSPEVDSYYMSVLQHIKGEAGWPITAIIDGDGLPIFVDSYLTKESLLKLLTRVNQVWQQQPEFLIQSAQRIDKLVKQDADISDIEHSEIDYRKINQQLIESLDSKHGGYLGTQKFPAEPMLAYALEQLSRAENKQLENLVKLQLARMSGSGIRDHLFGGFHRYATSEDWMLPHYEKMLYNQAQLIHIYTNAYLVFHDRFYLEVAMDTADALLDTFLNPLQVKQTAHGFITALDADFNGVEGGYYLWSKTELDDLAGGISAQYLYPAHTKLFGVLLENIPEKQNSMSVKSLREKLRNYKRASGALYFDSKVLTGWNGLAIKALADLSIVADEKRYFQVAQEVAKHLWIERYERSSGRLKRVAKSNQSQSIYLDDYAFLSSAFLSLYDIGGAEEWLERASELNDAANKYFVGSNGVINSANGTDLLHKVSDISDGEVFPAAATHIENSVMISKRLGETNAIKRFNMPINYLQTVARKIPQGHLYAAKSLAEINQSMRPIRFTSRGKTRVEFTCTQLGEGVCQTLKIKMTVKDGWHMNSNKPLQSHLVATQIKQPIGWQVTYPKPIEKTLSFQAEIMSLYEGTFQIILQRSAKDRSRRFMQLPVQVCSDSICLLPETLEFSM